MVQNLCFLITTVCLLLRNVALMMINLQSLLLFSLANVPCFPHNCEGAMFDITACMASLTPKITSSALYQCKLD